MPEPTPPPRSAPARPSSGNLPTMVTELRELVVAYAKQETVEPITALKHFMQWGIAGTVLTAFGLVVLALGGLRALQVETHLTGHLSWLPYLLVVVVAAAMASLAVRAIFKPTRKEH